MRDFKLTIVGLVLAVLIYVFSFLTDIDLFERFILFLEDVEHLEVDEFILPIFVCTIFALIDQFRRSKKQKVEVEKIKVYEAMLFSTHHILNNFLNQMQLFKMKAETSPDFDQKMLDLYDHVIGDAQLQIEKLSDVKEVSEKHIKNAVSPDNL